jgi:hypothetical protein
MQAVHVRHYLNRARDFLKGMDLLKDDPAEFKSSSALLAIHGAISYSDALRIGLGNSNISSEDHQSATQELKQLLTIRKYQKLDGVDKLAKLLGNKSVIAYGSVSVADERFKSIVQQAERFAVWAERTGKELGIEGW